ncbi:MAG: HAD family phosphatase [Chloroflexi bacterium]|nr:HAD family phosphatase [Chloroflexota bacterium]
MIKEESLLAVIFDFGGVLVDWSPYNLYRGILKTDEEINAFLEEIDFKNWNPRFDKGYPFSIGIEEICIQFPHRAELIRLFNDRWEEAMGGLLTGTIDVLRKIKEAGYPVYGLSNWSEEKFNLVKGQMEFLSLLDDFLISGEVHEIKPEPRIFNILLERIHRSSGGCIFVDDSPDNIRTANDLGFRTILFHSPRQLLEELDGMGICL